MRERLQQLAYVPDNEWASAVSEFEHLITDTLG